ncbi:MAG: GreA/GreB family elongation factor [Acidimicrobiia bacterium]
MSSALPSERAYLTEDGRRLLEDRVRTLAATVDDLHGVLDDPERRADHIEEYQRAAQELAGLRSLLDSARALDDVPDDPRVVELGDTVAIRLEEGPDETYIIVHAAEASMEDQRISAESPLGHALLGKHVGDTVEVPVPIGSYRCTILSASRIRSDHTD